MIYDTNATLQVCTYQQIGGDKNTRGAGPEFSHDTITSLLVHISVHCRHSESFLSQMSCQIVHTSPSITEDDSLGDWDGFVQIAQGLVLPGLKMRKCYEVLSIVVGLL